MKHRSTARIVGLINMALSILFTLTEMARLFVFAFSHPITVDIVTYQSETLQESEITITSLSPTAYFWMEIFLLIVIICLQVFGFWKLFEGTTKGADPKDCLHSCRIWRGIAIFLVVREVVQFVTWFFGVICIMSLFSVLLEIGRQASAIYLVQIYINNLTLVLPTKYMNLSAVSLQPVLLENDKCNNKEEKASFIFPVTLSQTPKTHSKFIYTTEVKN